MKNRILFIVLCLLLVNVTSCKWVKWAFLAKEEKSAPPTSVPPQIVPFPEEKPAPESGNVMIGGVYNVNGTNPDGQGSYSGEVTITPKGSVYELQWNVGNIFRGIGIRMGNVLSVSWGTPNQEGFGVVAYTINPDGSLNGTWATTDSRGLGAEMLMPKQ